MSGAAYWPMFARLLQNVENQAWVVSSSCAAVACVDVSSEVDAAVELEVDRCDDVLTDDDDDDEAADDDEADDDVAAVVVADVVEALSPLEPQPASANPAAASKPTHADRFIE